MNIEIPPERNITSFNSNNNKAASRDELQSTLLAINKHKNPTAVSMVYQELKVHFDDLERLVEEKDGELEQAQQDGEEMADGCRGVGCFL